SDFCKGRLHLERLLLSLPLAAALPAVSDRGYSERCRFVRPHFRFRQNFRIASIASSITSAVISRGGRNRIEFSPDRSVSTPRSKKPFQNSSRVFASGRSKARNNPRPRAAEIRGSSCCKARSCSRKYPPTFPAFSTRCSFSMMRRKCVERTMSVKLPPHVEFNRLDNQNALSFTHSLRGPAITPHTSAFFQTP